MSSIGNELSVCAWFAAYSVCSIASLNGIRYSGKRSQTSEEYVQNAGGGGIYIVNLREA